MGRLSDAFSALAVRDFCLLWGGTLFGTTAFMTSFLLVPIVAYEITGSYTASGIAQMGRWAAVSRCCCSDRWAA